MDWTKEEEQIIKDKQGKDKQQPIQYAQPIFNAVESARIGEIVLSSEVLRSDVLLGLIIGAISNEDVKTYLQVLECKKKSGGYVG